VCDTASAANESAAVTHVRPITSTRGQRAASRPASTPPNGSRRGPEEYQARERVKAADLLQIHRRQEDRHDVGDVCDGASDHQDGESGILDQRQIDQWPPHAVLDDDEHSERRERAGEHNGR